VHFYHQRSPERDALPLVLLHGWPGTVTEFVHLIGRLSDPRAHGSDPADAFHVIVPSLPGFAFSGPTKRGYSLYDVAVTLSGLPALLGYDRYGVQGGDAGASVALDMARLDPQHCIGAHVNLMIGGSPSDPTNRLAAVTPEEQAGLGITDWYWRDENAYMQLQRTKPQTAAFGLTDSPVGLAAWIVEKFSTWSDRDIESAFTKDELLTNIMLYWVTETINSSMRVTYYESLGLGATPRSRPPCTVPVGHAAYPREIIQVPRVWAENEYQIVHWERMASGGHFPSLEVPDAFVKDVVAFFRKIR
jgi:microsomal epoxide hydrolase